MYTRVAPSKDFRLKMFGGHTRPLFCENGVNHFRNFVGFTSFFRCSECIFLGKSLSISKASGIVVV